MKYKEICEKYLAGDDSAIALIDTLMHAGLNLNYLRNSNEYSKTNESDERLDYIDYNDTRAELDEVIDSISNDVKELGLVAPLRYSLAMENQNA